MTPGRSPVRLLALVVASGLVVAGIALVLVVVRGRASPDATGPPPPMHFDPDTVQGSARTRVEVLNASGITGLARRVTERLREAGYDVVYYGNAGSGDPKRTTVLARSTADSLIAAAIGERLGIARVELALDASRMVGVSVVLGKDWQQRRRGGRPGP